MTRPERGHQPLMHRPAIYRWHWFGLALTGGVLAIVFHATRLDLDLAAHWYDRNSHTFPWRDAWLTNYAVHRFLKTLEILAGMAMCVLAIRAARSTQPGFLSSHRRRLACVAISFIAVPATIGLLHHLSNMHCPWDIAEFGGATPYFDLLQATPAGVPRGQCFPSAFVSSGSWMLSFAWLMYPEHPRRCVYIALLAFAWAFALGWIQQMRGAHFLSHTLWSLWVSWAIVLLVHYACGAGREAP